MPAAADYWGPVLADPEVRSRARHRLRDLLVMGECFTLERLARNLGRQMPWEEDPPIWRVTPEQVLRLIKEAEHLEEWPFLWAREKLDKNARKAKLRPRKVKPRRGKLTPRQVTSIRAQWRQRLYNRVTVASLAKKYIVTTMTIRRVLLRQTWKGTKRTLKHLKSVKVVQQVRRPAEMDKGRPFIINDEKVRRALEDAGKLEDLEEAIRAGLILDPDLHPEDE